MHFWIQQYKVHLTETVAQDGPQLITDVQSDVAPATDFISEVMVTMVENSEETPKGPAASLAGLKIRPAFQSS
jgi:hypothetical protein